MCGGTWPPNRGDRVTRTDNAISLDGADDLIDDAPPAVQHDPYLGAFYQHLLAKGKFEMQALVAVMRKLLHAIHGMFKNHQPYDGSKLFQLPSVPAQEVPSAALIA